MKKEETMNIVCSTDDNYVPLCGIMLTSLFENNKGHYISVYILTEGISSQHRSLLKNITQRRDYNGEIHLCIVKDNRFNYCPIHSGDHVSVASYYRFLIPELLPQNIDKALYLDCDIIVNGSLSDLYGTDMSNVCIAACAEHTGDSYTLRVSEENINRLGYPKQWGYFNSGVMLLNLTYWRQKKVTDDLFAYVMRNHDKCLFHDQDTLNAVLGNKKKFIPYKYNFMTVLFTDGNEKRINPVILQERPIIIHYCTAVKPWEWYLVDYPFKKQWEHYRKMSLWKKWRGNKPWPERLKRVLIALLYKMKGKDVIFYDKSWKRLAKMG